MAEAVAIIGAGLIGRAWAIVFARGGLPVHLYDPDGQALSAADSRIGQAIADLEDARLIESGAALKELIETRQTLAHALNDAVYVQECGPETPEAKRDIFKALDAVAEPSVVLASSSSGIVASQFTDGLAHPERVLVAHPVNPPYLIPLVEICPALASAEWAVKATRELMARVGQTPITVRKEVQGFALNRLQGALLNEAMRLYEDGVASAEDLDRTVRDGLGLRWSFMGPFETIDLNAPGGLEDYATRYGSLFEALGREQANPRPWSPETIAALHAERRQQLAPESLPDRQNWRDRKLMALIAHKAATNRDIGE